MTELRIEENDYNKILEELAIEGKIDTIVNLLHKYLSNLSNRDFIKFDEKYIKLIVYCIAMNLKLYTTKSEVKVNRNYPDLLLVPQDTTKGYKSVMIEFKYLKSNETQKLKEKQEETKEQIKRYSEFEEIRNIENLNKYTIVAVNDKVYVDKLNM